MKESGVLSITSTAVSRYRMIRDSNILPFATFSLDTMLSDSERMSFRALFVLNLYLRGHIVYQRIDQLPFNTMSQ